VALFFANTRRRNRCKLVGWMQADAELFGFVEERIAAPEDIRALGAEPYVMRRLGQGEALRKAAPGLYLLPLEASQVAACA
jgi:hypothetical protein